MNHNINYIPLSEVALAKNKLSQVSFHNGYIYMLEHLPCKKKTVAVRFDSSSGKKEDLILGDYSIGNRVYEYGGGDYVIINNVFYFINLQDQSLCGVFLNKEKKIKRILFKKNERFGGLVGDEKNNKIYCICEKHTSLGVFHEVVCIDLNNNSYIIICSGRNFYSSLSLNKDASQLAYICWDHPTMPWDGTELWIKNLELMNPQDKYITGSNIESIVEPFWGNDGKLFFISDRSGWYNLYQYNNDIISQIFSYKGDMSRAQWKLGYKSVILLPNNSFLAICRSEGRDKLLFIHNNQTEVILSNFTEFAPSLANDKYNIYCIASSFKIFPTLLNFNLKNQQLVKLYSRPMLSKKIIPFSIPEKIICKNNINKKIYSLYYPPIKYTNDSKLPPLIVNCHGGPTFSCPKGIDLEIQFWTSRGFGYLDTDYSGSDGYGKEYRQSILGKWGIQDVNDVIKSVEYLIYHKIIDSTKIVIRGNSAGGFTALRAAACSNYFKAVTSYYGVVDVDTLDKHTHKFESSYCLNLIGKNDNKRYFINKLHSMETPTLFIHGKLDDIVPLSQLKRIIHFRKKKNLEYQLLVFDNERHGFSDSSNIVKAFHTELLFYNNVFNINS